MAKREPRPHNDPCEFCLRQYGILEDEKTGREKKIYFHDCLLLLNGYSCPFTARHCAYIYEQELFTEAIISIYNEK